MQKRLDFNKLMGTSFNCYFRSLPKILPLSLIIPLVIAAFVSLVPLDVWQAMAQGQKISYSPYALTIVVGGCILALILSSIWLQLLVIRIVGGLVSDSSKTLFEEVRMSPKTYLIGLAVWTCSVLILFAGGMLIVPGIFLSVPMSFLLPSVMLGQKSFGGAFKTSFKLWKGRWWLLFGANFLFTFAITMMAYFIFIFLVFFIAILTVLLKATALTALIWTLGAGLFIGLLMPISVIVPTVAYQLLQTNEQRSP